ncbi:MAG: PASTA domain-containing protein [Arachidicoccus sp.]|nr:PASTA domain-containing protein [Arachidicoccus sp.]
MLGAKNSISKFFINLLIIIFIVVALFIGFFASLGWITKHGESVAVPNVMGLNIDAAMQKISSASLKPVVLDSTYYDSLPALSVVSQSPNGGAQVKDGRIVYITINRAVAPTVQIPDLTGYSLSSASLLLKSFGLRVGKFSYTASPVRDAVVKQQIGDSIIAAGSKVPMGTAINLIIGDGTGSEMLTVPNLVGMQVSDAKDYLTSLKCSIGNITPDMDVAVADSGYIYKQSPEAQVSNDSGQTGIVRMKVGSTIDVWISKNSPQNHQ